MCLYILKTKFLVQEAQENILCYKKLEWNKVSEHKRFSYEKGVVNPLVHFEQFILKDLTSQLETGAGYYSFIESKSYATDLFVIPKGAKYCSGMDNCGDEYTLPHDTYISNTIVYIGNNNWFNRLKARLKTYKLPTNEPTTTN